MTAKSNAREGDGVADALNALDAELLTWSCDMKDRAFADLGEAVDKVRAAYEAAMQAQQGAEPVAWDAFTVADYLDSLVTDQGMVDNLGLVYLRRAAEELRRLAATGAPR